MTYECRDDCPMWKDEVRELDDPTCPYYRYGVKCLYHELQAYHAKRREEG